MRFRPTCAVLWILLLAGCGGQTNEATGGDGGGTLDGPTDATSDVGHPGDRETPDAPSDVSLGVDCGAPGQACCPTEACYGDGCCVDEVCHASGEACGHDLGTCKSGSCGGCGALGEACCPEYVNEGCSGVDGSTACPGCTQTGTTCNDGKCAACGAVGEICCFDSCTDEFSYCLGYTDDAGVEKSICSLKCGGPGQPCCEGDVCKNGGCCLSDFAGNLTCADSPTCGCTAGKCTTCGVLGHACCAGMTCGIDQGDCLTAGGSTMCQEEHP